MITPNEAKEYELKVFVTTHAGDVRPTGANPDDTIRVLLERAYEAKLPDGELFFFVEENEVPIELDITVAASGLKHRGQAHCAHCRKVKVKVRYNGQPGEYEFPASAKVRRVEEWAEQHFNIPPADRAELILRLCGSEAEENGDVRLGKLAGMHCEVCFDLGPKQRVQG